jgi:hypothetical protein
MIRSAQLVGRRHELAQLRKALDTAASGAGGLVLLAGEAGVGKTRLTVEALSTGGARFAPDPPSSTRQVNLDGPAQAGRWSGLRRGGGKGIGVRQIR